MLVGLGCLSVLVSMRFPSVAPLAVRSLFHRARARDHTYLSSISSTERHIKYLYISCPPPPLPLPLPLALCLSVRPSLPLFPPCPSPSLSALPCLSRNNVLTLAMTLTMGLTIDLRSLARRRLRIVSDVGIERGGEGRARGGECDLSFWRAPRRPKTRSRASARATRW